MRTRRMPTRLSQMRWTQFALTPLQMPSVSCSLHRSSNYFLNCSAQPSGEDGCLLAFIHRPGLPAATREGWRLHMCYIRGMLPWVFASDKTNYARYLSVYWCEMMLLPWTYLHANAVLESGQFAVQRSSNSTNGPDDRIIHEQGMQHKGRHQF